MIKIFGSPKSSARRCYWMLEELGIKYERQPLDMSKKEHKDERYLKLNPNGKVPCLTDGDFVIWESMAINSYLCEKYGNAEWTGRTPEEKGLIQQWSFWAIAELQRPLVDMLIQMVFIPEERRDLGVVERSKKAAEPLLQILDKTMANKTYLVGDRFTLADLNVASVVSVCHMCQHDISGFRNVMTWLKACMSRPAIMRVHELP